MRNIGIPYAAIDPEIIELAEQHDGDPKAVLEILQALQARHGSLSERRIEDVARALNTGAARVQGIATFYTMLATDDRPAHTLRICDGPPCMLRGADVVRAAAEELSGGEWHVERTSCLGLCDLAPAALVDLDPAGPLTSDRLPDLFAGRRGELPRYDHPLPGETRSILAGAGEIDPGSIESALEHGAYRALEKALARPPAETIDEVEKSGLRGRGGAGFPAGRKWRFVSDEPAPAKYIVCNADESEPLVFKDRVVMDGVPHRLLEGIAIAGYVAGAREGFIYIRGEYERQARILETAVRQAEERGFLGNRILGSDFSFKLHVHRGAGAYICGEETALLNSLEGKRGEPRVRPPYPTTHGYRGMPTVVNNVETLAAVPAIVLEGAGWYRSIGHPEHPGTKLYTLLGHVNRPGLFEAPFGLTLREIIENFGGGMAAGSDFHFALAGGAAGTIVPESLLDVPITFASAAQGVSLGAGAFLVCDRSVSPVDLVRQLIHFFEVESCGLCTPCRIGTRRAGRILDGLLAGDPVENASEKLAALARLLEGGSLCGLGQSAPWALNSAMAHYPELFLTGKEKGFAT
ncbi:MAG TPA: NAD(P)H-dependent oxidoreductase subunit E [Anaerolineales bacterium]|nr:NAD(P)H-dependent oxidoreductase subunit E [Anaerolineales bacterium]